MEYILQNTDICDEEITEKFEELIVNSNEDFIKQNAYKLTVRFDATLLYDKSFDEFNLPAPSKINEGIKENKIYDVLSFQLGRLEQILKENEIQIWTTVIQGDYLEVKNIIKIEIHEDTSEPFYRGSGSNKKRMKTRSIIPSLPYIQDAGTNFAAERLSEIFYDLFSMIKDKKLLSEILEIEETEDDETLIEAFYMKYGELAFISNVRKKELLDQFHKRILFVVKNYIENKNKT